MNNLKLQKTAILLTKQIPVFGQVVSVAEELYSIWAEDQKTKELINTIQSNVLNNLANLLNQKNEFYDKEQETIKQHILQNKRLVESFRREMINLQCEIARNSNFKNPIFAKIVTSYWTSTAIKDGNIPEEFRFMLRSFTDLDFKILLHIFARGNFWNEVFLEPKYLNLFPGHLPNEICFSASKLCHMGFLTESNVNNQLNLEEREWKVNTEVIDKFYHKLDILPVVAILPLNKYFGADNSDDVFFNELSQETLRLFSTIPTIRRHPYHGYQWNGVFIRNIDGTFVDTSKQKWEGENWQYNTIEEAINVANFKLKIHIAEPQWIYLSV